VTYRMQQAGAVMVLAILLAGCASADPVNQGKTAASRGEWDLAVEYYRDALGKDPANPELKIWLSRAITSAAADHVKRARELEALNEFPGALAEYKKAFELEPSNTLARTKASEIDRRLKAEAAAVQQPPRIEALRQQAQQSPAIPKLDPRMRVPLMHYTQTAVRDLLRTISDLTGLNLTYDASANTALGQAYTIDVQDAALEDVLFQIFQQFNLTYKVINSRTILVYLDTVQNRTKYEDVYWQTFYLSNAAPADVQSQLSQLFASINMTNRPVFSQSQSSNSITVRTTAAALEVISEMVRSIDRPVPEVFIEGEILEVDRSFIRQLGLDLNQWALGFTLSPEVIPPSVPGVLPPTVPPPFSLNALRPAPGRGDIFMTAPTMVIKLLESNSNTKVLARPAQRGRAGQQISLTLGDQVPIPQTVFSSAAAGGLNNIPTTQVQYQAVGVNLLFTPKVTYRDEIILDALRLERSGLGANLDVGGQTFPTIVSRTANTSIGLRDGESTLIAGLLKDDDRKTATSFPGLSRIPVLNSIFGNTERQVEQSEIIMVITAHIVRGHELTVEDMRPHFIGAGTNIGIGAQQLLLPEALLGAPGASAPLASTAPGPGGLVSSAPASADPAVPTAPPAAEPSAAARAPGVVPIQAVPSGPSPPSPAGQARIAISAPPGSADGSVPAGGGPFTMPIQISGVQNVAAVSLAITYDPAVMTNVIAGQGAFMMQNGVSPVFAPRMTAGRVEMAFARPASQPGASGAGVLGAISFNAGTPGTTDVVISGVVTTTTGQSIPLQFTPARITVR